MKKLYALLIGATMVSGQAMAENVAKVVNPGQAVSVNTDLKVRQVDKDHVSVAPKTSAIEDYADYTWNLLGTGQYKSSVVSATYAGGEGELVDVQVYEAEGHSGVYKVVGVWADILDSTNGELVIDASNPDFVTVPKQFTRITDEVDGETYIASLGWVYRDVDGIEEAKIIQGIPENLPIFRSENKCIYFPEKSLVLQWPNAPEDSSYKTDPTGWYNGGAATGCLVLPGGTYWEAWTLVGEGTFSGDVLYQAFTEADGPDYNVNVYRSTLNETLYRVNDPLKGLYAALEFNGTSPSWKIDVTDPENISIPITTTQINGGTQHGVYYVLTANQSYKTIEECPEAMRGTFTNEGGNLTFSIPVHGLLMYASTAQSLFYGNNAAFTLTVRDDSAAIEDIITDTTDDNAPAEYFNLQGIKVANPEAGQFYIVRQGKKVSKIIK